MNRLDRPAACNRRTRQSRLRAATASAAVDALERRLLLSGTGTLTPVATFNGADGFSPVAAVADAQGNLFGVTAYTQVGNNTGSGVLFEVPAGTGTIKVLSTLGNGEGITEGDSLIIDSSGNLFGTEISAPSDGGTVVFEVAQGTSVITPLATFSQQASATQGRVTAVDSAGDLYGIDSLGGLFEVVKGSGTVTSLASDFSQSQLPLYDLELNPNGNLYGVTPSAIVEYAPSTGIVTTLATFDTAVTGTTPLGITFDSNNDIWGFSEYGGPEGNGTIWELPAGSNTVSLAASFTSATGYTPVTRPVIDSSGNLWGLTSDGGANGDGTLFEFSTSSVSDAITASSSTGGLIKLAPASDTSGLSDASDLNTDDAGSQGAGVVTGDMPYKTETISGIVVFEPLAGDVSEAEGAILTYIYNEPPPPSPPPFKFSEELMKEIDDLVKHLEDEKAQETQELMDLIKALNGMGSSIVFSKVQPAAGQAITRSGVIAEFAPVRALLGETGDELKTAQADVSKQPGLYGQYTRQSSAIIKLNAQLAAARKASVEAEIRKKIAADTALQSKFATEDTTLYNAATAELASISTLETNIESDLDSLRSPAKT